MENHKLEQIIKACTKGKPEAQNFLYVEYAPKLLGVCLRYSGSVSEAEDTLQEGFIKIFSSIKTYKFKGSFEGWMRRIMVNTALEKFRQSKKIQLAEEAWESESDVVNNEGSTHEDVPLDVLLEMVQQLPDRYQMVFNLYVLDGYTHNEIAEVMGISTGTSKSNLARGRAILKQKVQEYLKKKETRLRIC